MDDGAVLERLLACYSPSGEEAKAVAEFGRLARSFGYRTRVDRVGNGVAERGRGRPLVLFLGHIDTVEGERPVRRRAGRIHGRGAVDAKGALVTALLAGRGFVGPGTFRIVAAVGEETDSRGAHLVARGARPDAVIAGEPSGWDGLTIGYKGDLRFRATFSRPRSHWSSPFPTAADLAVAWVADLRAALGPGVAGSPFRSPSAKVVGFSSDPASDPEVATVTLDVRLPPGLSTAEAIGRFPPATPRPQIQLLTRIEPLEVRRDDPVVDAFCRAIRAHGGTPTLWRRSGTSDLNVVARRWGPAGVAYGPGDSRLDHTSRESLPLADLARATGVLRAVIERLSGSAPGAPTPRRSAAVP